MTVEELIEILKTKDPKGVIWIGYTDQKGLSTADTASYIHTCESPNTPTEVIIATETY